MTSPLRIIREPQLVYKKKGEDGTNTTHKIMIVSCDDGNDYTLAQLGEKIGKTMQWIGYNIKALGWDHPDVLNTLAKKVKGGRPMSDGNGLWQSLSGKPRSIKLSCLPRPGSFEQAYCSKNSTMEEAR